MLHKFFRRRTKSPSRPARARRPALEVLEDRCVPDASQIIALPPGQNIFQFASSIIQNVESVRTQIDGAISADEQQTVMQEQQNLSVADQINQALHGQVVQDQQQLASDAASGASPPQQGADLLKAVRDQQIAQSADSVTPPFKAAQAAQAEQKIQADEQQKAATDQAANQVVASVQNQLVNLSTGGAGSAAVGAPLTAGQSIKYSGTFTVIVTEPNGVTTTSLVGLGVVINVGKDGVTLTGNAQESVSVLNPDGSINSTTNSTSGMVNGRLSAPGSTAATGTFSFTFPSGTPPSAPWTGNLGSNDFTGQVTDPSSGVKSPFVLTLAH